MNNISNNDVEEMILEQRTFYFSGKTQDIEFRKRQLKRLRESIKKYERELLRALKLDLNKSEFEAYTNEVGFVLDSIKYIIKNIDEWSKPQQVKTPLHLQPAKSFTVREAYGVVLIIGPFNYPFQLVMEPLIGAIIGGNTAIIKPSEASIHTTEIVKKIIAETFESNYVHIIEGEKEVVTALIHASFDYIFFTGSVAVGKIVMRAASERLTPITLELGGKSPTIVDQTAKIDTAVKRIVWGKFSNNGQTCIAPDYVLIHSSVYKKFVEKLKKTIRQFYGENPRKSEDYGRVINERQFNRLISILEKEKDNITFGGSYCRKDLYIEPAVIENVSWASKVMEDEIFGPILPIMPYDDLRLVIHQIRRLPKPLAAYFFSENEKAIQYFLQELPFGGGCINDTLMHCANPYLPFGGVGPSGVNAYHGKASYENFTHAKSVMKRTSKLTNNLVFPPYKHKVKLVRKILK